MHWTIEPVRTASCAALLTLGACTAVPPSHERVAQDLEQVTGLQAGDPASDEFFLPPDVQLADGLSEREAAALALANNPDFKAQLAELGVSAAEVVRAGQLPNPALAAVFGSSWEATLTFPFDILWKRSARLEVAETAHAGRIQQVIQNGLDLVLEARLGHVNALLAQRQLDLTGASVTRTGRVSDIAKSRLGTGDASGLEAASTGAEAAIAVQDASRARLQREAATLVLRRLCRLDPASWNGALSPSLADTTSAPDIDALIKLAQENRADVRAAALGLEAAGASIGLARAEAFSFAAGAKASDSNDGTTVAPALSASLPLFDRGQAGVFAAQARLQGATQLYRARLEQADFEVRDTVARLEQSSTSLRSWRQEIVPALSDTVARSERAYLAGDIPYLAVLVELRRLIDAQRAEAEALADVQRAVATLAHHVGGSVAWADEGATR